MAQQSLSCRFIVCWNFLFRTKIQHNIQNDFVFLNAERTVPVFNNRVCPSGIKARNQTTIFVHSDRKLRLVAIMERMLHPDRRFHNFLYKIRGKAADPDQVVFDLAVLKGELLFIGNRLQLTAATLSRIRTDRLHAVGRRFQHFFQTRKGISLFRFYDFCTHRIAQNRVLDKQRITIA